MHVCAYLCAYMCICVPMHLHVCTYVYAYVCIWMFVCACMFVCTCSCMFLCVCVYVYARVCMHANVHHGVRGQRATAVACIFLMLWEHGDWTQIDGLCGKPSDPVNHLTFIEFLLCRVFRPQYSGYIMQQIAMLYGTPD